jgi:hypothetical protein
MACFTSALAPANASDEKQSTPDEKLGRRWHPAQVGAEKLINRGYALPLPIGVSIIGETNLQDQTITELNLALGKGAVAPVDVKLSLFPAGRSAAPANLQRK